MKKKLYFIQLFLKNGESYCMCSYSKKRVLISYKLWFRLFDGHISLMNSNFALK